VVGFAQVMVVLDTTVVNMALPLVQRALHFSNGDRQWVVTACALAFGSLLRLAGRIGDLFGRKSGSPATIHPYRVIMDHRPSRPDGRAVAAISAHHFRRVSDA
jgi:MFS family permease